MPSLNHTDSIRQYYEEVKTNHPSISFEEFEAICKSPFIAVKYWIRSGNLPIIMLKYFGKFKVFLPKIDKLLAKRKQYDEKKYNLSNEILEKYKKDFGEDGQIIDYRLID